MRERNWIVDPDSAITFLDRDSAQSPGNVAMEYGFLGRIIDRVIANARVIRRAPEAIVLTAIITLGISFFGFQHFHRERVTALNDRIASQERLVADYRTKLRGATPDEAVTQIEKLTSLLAQTQKALSEQKSKPLSFEKRLLPLAPVTQDLVWADREAAPRRRRGSRTTGVSGETY